MNIQVIYFILGLLGSLNLLLLTGVIHYAKSVDGKVNHQNEMLIRIEGRGESQGKDISRIEKEIQRIDKSLLLTDAELARQKFQIHTLEGSTGNTFQLIKDHLEESEKEKS